MNELVKIYEQFQKNPFSFLKENLSIIIIIPAILGGLWQLEILININFSLIRYFSISQIVPDGLLVVLICFILVFISIIFKFILDILKNIIMKRYNKSFSYYVNARMILITVFTLLIYFYFKNSFLKEMVFTLVLFVYIIYFFIMFKDYNDINNENDNVFYKYKKSILVVYFFFIYFFVYFFSFFPKDNFITNGIYNFKELNEKMNTNKLSKNEILYFNDKYIFIKNTTSIKLKNNKMKTSESIKILPMDVLMKIDFLQ